MAEKQTPAPWYSEEAGFFGPGYLSEYAAMLTETSAEVDFLERVLGLVPGAKIFDCPCGHGRHSIELARRGYQATGQDINSFFLGEAERAASEAEASVRWIQGDMREVPFEGEFDAVVNLFTAFGYLESDDEDQKALNQLAKALKRGGKFVLDFINRDRIVRTYREKDWRELPDGSVILNERKFDHSTGRNNERRIRIWRDREREEFSLSVRMYTVVEFAAMFRKAGLNLKEIYGSYGGESFTFNSRRAILVAEKD